MIHNTNDPQNYSEEQQVASEPDFYGKYKHISDPPQDDFEVIASCDDDVKMCVWRLNGGDGYFELPDGTEFKATQWMSKPEPFNKGGI